MKTAVFFNTLTDEGMDFVVRGWKKDAPEGACLALVAEHNKDDIPQLQACFNKAGYPLLGAMFPEVIAEGGFQQSGVVLLHFQHCPRYWLIPDMPANAEDINFCLDPLVVGVRQAKEENAGLFLLFDAMVPNIATVLEKLYLRLTDSVQYFGVNAGSETFRPMPCLFDNDQFVGNGLLAMLLPQHEGAMLAHDYHMPGMQVTATAAEGNRITSINWQPAFEAYQALVKEHYDVDITPENFYQYGVHFPFGISRLEGDPLVRIPVALNDDGSLFCVGEVPPNTLLTVLNAVNEGSDETVNKLCDYIKTTNSKVMLNFYCAGRRLHLGEDAGNELVTLIDRCAPRPVFGALSLGEIGCAASNNYPLFHNAALVAIPWN